jgi:hypothetical protein
LFGKKAEVLAAVEAAVSLRSAMDRKSTRPTGTGSQAYEAWKLTNGKLLRNLKTSATDIPAIRRLIVSFCQVFYGTALHY